MTRQHAPSRNTLAGIAVLLITAVVAALQLYWASVPLYGYDEAWHTYEARISPIWKTFLVMSADQHPFLYYLLLRPFAALGTDPIYPRLLSVIPTILTIPLWYLLLRRFRFTVLVALTATVVLAAAYSFQSAGITIRAYSLTVLLLLGALWYWAELLPLGHGQPCRPSRRSSIFSLALFSAAFWCLYAAAFATAAVFGATLLVMALSSDAQRAISDNFKRYSRWPEWLLFFALHLAGVFWYWIGWARHVSGSTPSHVAEYARADGQPLLEFLHQGLRNQLELLTPLFGLDPLLVDTGAIALLALVLALTWRYLRAGNPLLAVVALIPLLLTAILALLGAIDIYPFGGQLRHQYVSMPFLLMLLPLTLHSIWGRLPNLAVQSLIATVVVAVAIVTSVRTYQDYKFIGDAPVSARWDDRFSDLFATASAYPTFIPSFAFFPTYIDRMDAKKNGGMWYRSSYRSDSAGYHIDHQGWLSIAMPWPAYEEFAAIADDGSELVVVKDQYRWRFDMVPDALFFKQLRNMLIAMGHTSARVFAPQESASEAGPDELALRAVASQHGFGVASFQALDRGAIWVLEMTAPAPCP